MRAIGAALHVVPQPGHPPRVVAPRASPTAVLAAACGILFLIGVNTTAINTALNGIAADLEMGTGELAWSVGIYLLAVAAFVLLGGRLGDLFGERAMILAGLAIYGLGAVLVAIADTGLIIIAGRAVQGLGGAVLMPATMAVQRIAYPPERQGLALGVWGAVGGAAFALGPLIGGAFTDTIGWRWIWWATLIAAACLALAALTVMRAMPRPSERPRFDWPGIVLLPVALFGLILAIQQGPSWGWGSVPTIAAFAVSLAAFVALVVVERRREVAGRDPMLHLGLLRTRELLGANIGTFANAVTLIGVLFFFNLYAQSAFTLDESALVASVELLPYGGAMFIASLLIGPVCDRVGFRWPIAAGLALMGLGGILTAEIDVGDGYGSLWWPTAILGVGVGVTFSQPSAAGLRSVPAEKAGEASGIINVARYIGAGLAISIGSVTFITVASDDLGDARAAAGLPGAERTTLDQTLTEASADVESIERNLDRRERAALRASAPTAVVDGFAAVMRGLGIFMLACAAVWIGLMRPRHAAAPGAAAR